MDRREFLFVGPATVSRQRPRLADLIAPRRHAQGPPFPGRVRLAFVRHFAPEGRPAAIHIWPRRCVEARWTSFDYKPGLIRAHGQSLPVRASGPTSFFGQVGRPFRRPELGIPGGTARAALWISKPLSRKLANGGRNELYRGIKLDVRRDLQTTLRPRSSKKQWLFPAQWISRRSGPG